MHYAATQKRLNIRISPTLTKLKNYLTTRISKVPRATIVGVVGVMLLYLGVAGTISSVVPWSIGGDTRPHVDYVWRVYNGSIPKFNDGITYTPVAPQKPEIQQAASNPPLYYALLAPFMGPFLHEGEWQEAIAIGRTVNLAGGIGSILMLAWGGWVLGGKRRALMAVATPAIGALTYRFVTLNIIFGLDAFLVLLSTFALIIIAKVIKQGVDTKSLLWLMLVSVLGMSLKAPYIVILGVSALAIIIASFIHGTKDTMRQDIVRGIFKASLMLSVTALAIGWFYYLYNYQTGGRWFSGAPLTYSGGREYKSLGEVISGTALWSVFYERYAKSSLISVAMTSFALAGVFTVSKTKIKSFFSEEPHVWTFFLFTIAVIGIFLTQLVLAVGYGSINFRYMLPVLLPISLFLGYGLLQFEWMRGQFITIFSMLMGATATFPVASSTTMEKFIPELAHAGSSIDKLFVAAAENGLPTILIFFLLSCFFVGLLLLAYSLYALTSYTDEQKVA